MAAGFGNRFDDAFPEFLGQVFQIGKRQLTQILGRADAGQQFFPDQRFLVHQQHDYFLRSTM